MGTDVAEQPLGPLLIELGPRIAHLTRHALRRVDPPLTYTQFRALLHISRGKTTLSELREPSTVAISTLSEVVDALGKRDLVQRRPSERDRRAVDLALTPAGEQVLQAAQERLQALAEQLTAGVSPAARAWLAETLAPVNAAAEQLLVAMHRDKRGGDADEAAS